MKPLNTKIHADLLAALVGVGILMAAPVMAKDHAEGGTCKHMRGHHGGMMLKHFDEVDADKDGKITQDELKAHHDAKRAEVDSDDDGKLSKAEFLAKAEKRAERKFARMDKNEDGFITEDEKKMKKHHGKADYFNKLDADKDGALTKQELEAGKAKMMERMKKHHGDKADDHSGDKS